MSSANSPAKRSAQEERLRARLVNYNQQKGEKTSLSWKVIRLLKLPFYPVWGAFPELFLHLHFVQGNRRDQYPLNSQVETLKQLTGEYRTIFGVTVLFPLLITISLKRFIRGRSRVLALTHPKGLFSTGLMWLSGFLLLNDWEGKVFYQKTRDGIDQLYREAGLEKTIAEKEYSEWLRVGSVRN